MTTSPTHGSGQPPRADVLGDVDASIWAEMGRDTIDSHELRYLRCPS